MLQIWAQRHIFLFFVLLTGVRIAGIVWPPLPGGIFTLGSIPILGWRNAYTADLIGSILGSMIAFWLARTWGEELLVKIFDQATVQKIKRLRVKKHRELEAVFMFRLFGGTIVEAICYGAGLLRVGYGNFFIATVASHAVVSIPTFYFAHSFLENSDILLNTIFIIILVPLFFIAKRRYFEYT